MYRIGIIEDNEMSKLIISARLKKYILKNSTPIFNPVIVETSSSLDNFPDTMTKYDLDAIIINPRLYNVACDYSGVDLKDYIEKNYKGLPVYLVGYLSDDLSDEIYDYETHIQGDDEAEFFGTILKDIRNYWE